MPREHICPTCATVLGPLHAAHLRRCNACNRHNPHQFNYCGFCASPLENTQMRAKLAEIAAPPGGWPSLTAELVELRFFSEQGQLEDAFELLSILQKRHPGHPALTDFARRAEPSKADTEVGELVESLLASSPGLAGKMLRRGVPTWDAPQVAGSKRTSVHEVVDAQRVESAVREPTRIYRVPRHDRDDAKKDASPSRAAPGKTIAVDVLMPAAPFVGAEDDEIPPRHGAEPVEERVSVRAPAAGEIEAPDTETDERARKRVRRKRERRPRRGGSGFGQHVLSRLGG